MGSDEERAFKLLKKNRKLQRPLIAKYGGKFLKEMGDGILASFDTSSDAVKCAGAIQRSAGEEDIRLRIGIHQGEVVFEGNDVIGDGVNVASRLQELADPESTYISGAVYKDIKNKAGISTAFIGERTLKNVEEPVKVYKASVEGIEEIEYREDIFENDQKLNRKRKVIYLILSIMSLAIIAFLIWQLIKTTSKDSVSAIDQKDKSIAVIPFWNDSPDPDNEYFCNGMEEEIRIQLLKISDLKVESRQSVEKYRENPEKDLITIGEELDVSYIVEGSVRKIGDDIRVTVQLINAVSGDHVWGDTYDGDYTLKLLDFQSSTAKEIVSSLNAAITPREENLLSEKQTDNIEAYDKKLRGDKMWNNYWNTLNEHYLDSAHHYYDLAIQKDPDYKTAISSKTRTYLDQGVYDSVLIYADRQISLDPASPIPYHLKGEAYRAMGKADLAIELMEMAASRAPDNLWYHLILSHLYCGSTDNCLEGYKYIKKVVEKDLGKSPNVQYYIGGYYLNIGDYQTAEVYTKRSLEYGFTCPGLMFHVLVLNAQNRFQDALQFVEKNCENFNCAASWCEFFHVSSLLFLNLFSEVIEICNQYDGKGMFKELIECHRIISYWKIGKINEAEKFFNDFMEDTNLEEFSSFTISHLPYYLAGLHATFGKGEEAMKIVMKFENYIFNNGKIDYIPFDPFYDVLREDPEFKSILKHKQDERAAVLLQIQELEAKDKI
jgi:TolB-like protein